MFQFNIKKLNLIESQLSKKLWLGNEILVLLENPKVSVCVNMSGTHKTLHAKLINKVME